MFRGLDQARSLPAFDLESWLATLESSGELPSCLVRRLRTQRDVINSDFLCSLPKFTALPQLAPCVAASAAPGDEIGPYELQRLLGAGGMGSVWLARRKDDASGSVVALKLAHTTMAGVVPAEVMERERAILAALDHPHIVRLHDAGITQEGRAYLALEYVEGEHIDQYCVGRGLRRCHWSEPVVRGILCTDLEAIVLKALKRCSAERYRSVEELARDTEQYL